MVALHHTIVTGQSLANGAFTDTLASTNPQTNTHLHRVNADGSLSLLDTPSTNQLPERTLGERVQTGSYEMTVNTNAKGSTAYSGVKKGTTTYSDAIARVSAGYSAAVARGDTFTVTALHVIHGEQDEGTGTTREQYAADLAEWIADYTADVKAITGQADNPKLLFCQLGSSRVADVAPAQLDAHRAGYGTLVTPKYHLPYYNGVHLSGVGYYRLGEYHGMAHKATVIDGGTWQPVAPLWIRRRGVVITVKFSVPAGPLVFDTTQVPAQSNYGFSWKDSTFSADVTSATLISADTVQVMLNHAPTGTNHVLQYGYADVALGRGNLRDSATATSAYDGAPLHNWCVQFSDPVPFGDQSADPIPPSNAIRISSPAGAAAAAAS